MWFFNRSLESVVNKTKTIRVHGVKFIIKKIDITSYLDGSKVMLQMYDLYKVGKGNSEEANRNINKVKDHYKDVFMASVVEPKLSRENGVPEHTYVDYLFTEWDLANELYGHIIELTYGKKKLKQSNSQEKNS